MTPVQAIRAKCIDCCCGSIYEPAKCTATQCSLYPFREGHNPNIKSRGYKDMSHVRSKIQTCATTGQK